MTRLPAEWEPQSAILLAWPHADTDWHERLRDAEACYVRLTAAITCFQTALICVADEGLKKHVRRLLDGAAVDPDKVRFAVVPYNDTWTRDYGPICVNSARGLRLLDFQFNGWGEKFHADLDNQVTIRLGEQGWFNKHPIEHISWVLEGGAIESDGRGTLLTTSSCLENVNRNGALSRPEIESVLIDRLGIRSILWLERGDLEGDDTDGHVDQLARFCDPGTIAYCADDGNDAQADSLQAMADQLCSLRQPDGTPYRLVALPVPQPIRDQDGRRLPASYANFLIINRALLVPSYNDPADEIALTGLRACFPGHTLVPVPARALIAQGGSLHCATMQLPAGALAQSHDTMV